MFKLSILGETNKTKAVINAYQDIARRNARILANRFRSETPIGTNGRLARSWRVEGEGLTVSVVNLAPYANWGIRGRPAGKQPPIAKIAPWAKKRGLNPYAVAKKIGERGTERYRTQKNWVGLKRDDTLKRNSPAYDTARQIAQEFKSKVIK